MEVALSNWPLELGMKEQEVKVAKEVEIEYEECERIKIPSAPTIRNYKTKKNREETCC